MVKSVEATQAEIHWDPPKGEFTKYTLMFEKVSGDNVKQSLTRLISSHSKTSAGSPSSPSKCDAHS